MFLRWRAAGCQDEERERNREGMAAADLESAFYRYYSKLQPAIMAINQQRQALRDISTRWAKLLPEKQGKIGVATGDTISSETLSGTL